MLDPEKRLFAHLVATEDFLYQTLAAVESCSRFLDIQIHSEYNFQLERFSEYAVFHFFITRKWGPS